MGIMDTREMNAHVSAKKRGNDIVAMQECSLKHGCLMYAETAGNILDQTGRRDGDLTLAEAIVVDARAHGGRLLSLQEGYELLDQERDAVNGLANAIQEAADELGSRDTKQDELSEALHEAMGHPLPATSMISIYRGPAVGPSYPEVGEMVATLKLRNNIMNMCSIPRDSVENIKRAFEVMVFHYYPQWVAEAIMHAIAEGRHGFDLGTPDGWDALVRDIVAVLRG